MKMSRDILVTGGTGTLGRLLVPRLRDAGHRVRVLSRHSGSAEADVEYLTGDLATGEGVGAAVEGVEVVVHCAGTAKGDGEKARTLVEAAAPAGVRHLVFISVVGADRVPIESPVDRAMFGYYGSKLAAERAVAASGLPWTTLRATQFHDLVYTTVRQLTRLPVVPVPALRFQPVDTVEVADRLAELAEGPPAGLVDDLAGGPGRTSWPRALRRDVITLCPEGPATSWGGCTSVRVKRFILSSGANGRVVCHVRE